MQEERIKLTELLDKAISSALDGDAILFLGAGVGKFSKDQSGIELPTGSGLSEEISKLLSLEEVNYELSRVAQYFRRINGAFELYNLLKSRLEVSYVDQEFQDFLRLPWKRIYTTNYDNCVETVRPTKKSHSILTEPINIDTGDCIHLNGYIKTVTHDNLDDSVILTDWNYANSNLYNSSWANLFRNDIVSTSYIIFLGYSMRDLDIARIVSLAGEKIKNRVLIIVSPETNKIDMEVLGDFGTVFSTGAEHALRRVKYAKKKHSNIEKPYLYSSLRESRLPNSISKPENLSKILYDQFVYGIVPRDIILSFDDSSQHSNVYFKREVISEASEKAYKGEISSIIITGGVATGKTYGTIQIEKFFLQNSIKVFRAINARNIRQDLAEACKNETRTAFIFENYQDYIDDIEYLSNINARKHIIILSARTVVHELYEQKIEKILGPKYFICDLERLSLNEIGYLDPMLNQAGLWSDLAGWKPQRRVAHVRSSLGSSLARLLLKIVRSTEVKERIQSEIKPILDDSEVSSFFICSLIINVLQFEFWIHDWLVFFNSNQIDKALKKYETSIGHFINLSTASVTLRSSLLANELIESVIDDRLKVDALKIVYEGASENAMHDEEMSRLRIKLMMYSQVTRFFDDNPNHDKEKREALKTYYLSIREFRDTVNRSDYWLQYGIMLSIHGDIYNQDDVEQAEVAFSNAFQREKARSRPNLVRVDNYYARFQLKKAIATQNSDESFELFMLGSQKLMSQVFDEETRHYPFKVGRLYSDIASVHYGNWTVDQKNRFFGRCRELHKLAEKRLQERNQKDVDFLVKDLKKLMENLEGHNKVTDN